MANCIYQYSLLSALMHGICREGTSLSRILKHGDHGLGTISGLNGEIVIIDGAAYHFPPDGPLRIVQESDILPYIMVTRFQPTFTKEMKSLSMSSLFDAFSSPLLLRSQQNTFISIRIQATFPRILFRVIPAQSKPRESLSHLARRQEVKERTNVHGLLFGFWSPAYASGFSVSGFHMHFLSDDRTAGGHVMDFEAIDVQLQAAQIRDYHIELPASEEFQEVPIGNVLESELHAAEGC